MWLERLPGQCSEESRCFQKAMPSWVPGAWRLVPPRPVSAGCGSGVAPVLAPAPPTSDSIPRSCGVESSAGAAARGQLAKGKCVRVIPILLLTGCPTASVTWAQPILGTRTCRSRHRNGASGTGWQNSFGVASDKCRENTNFLSNNLLLCEYILWYLWNLLGDWHYLTLLHQLISGEIQDGPLHPLRSRVRIGLEIQVHKYYLTRILPVSKNSLQTIPVHTTKPAFERGQV